MGIVHSRGPALPGMLCRENTMRRVMLIGLLALSTSASAMTYFLVDQWTKGGSRFCKYGNGTVLNVGVGLCPLSIEG